MIDGAIPTERYEKIFEQSWLFNETANAITSVAVISDISEYERNLPELEDGVNELCISDFDGVVGLGTVVSLFEQINSGIFSTGANFNAISDQRRAALVKIKNRGALILTTNRSQIFNRPLEWLGANPIQDEVHAIDHRIEVIEGLDRQDPFLSKKSYKEKIESLKEAIAKTDFPGKTDGKRVLRFIFDIRNFLAIMNDVALEAGIPLELHSVKMIIDACKELNCDFDEIHIGIINPWLKSEP